jgi:hypothetical protein
MTDLVVLPLLAADPATIIGLVVGALTLLGWILNYANQKQAQQPPPARPNRPVRPQRPGDDRLQSEIDVFLEEVRGGRRKLANEPSRPAAEAPRQPQRPVQQRPVQQPPRKPVEQPVRRPLQSGEQRPVEPRIAQPVEPRVAQRKRPVAGERTRLRPRVADHLSSERIEAHASQLGRGVEAAVQSHLGLLTAADAPTAAAVTAVPVAAGAAPPAGDLAQQVRSLLARPEGVRQAVLISEILRRPRVGRRGT